MKRKMIGILICVLMTSSVLASAGNVLPNNTDNNTISVDIQVGAYDIDNTNSGYQVSMDNFGQLLIPGKPNLPSKIFSIAIPPGAEIVDVDYSTTDTIISGVYNIIPSPLPRVIGEEDPVLYEKDLQRYNDNYNSVYTSNSPYPSSIVEINGNGGYRKYNLVDVRVNPITYYPQSGSLVYHSTISISIEYNIAQGFSTSDIINDNLPQTEKIAK
jgi:hypothetical protein